MIDSRLIRVYQTSELAENDLVSYVERNLEIVEKVIPRKNNLRGSRISISHLIELYALEEDENVSYFFGDSIWSMAEEDNESFDDPYASIDELAFKVRERTRFQKQRCERETRCKVTILPIIYTVKEEQAYDANSILNTLKAFSKIFGIEADIMEGTYEVPYRSVERRLTKEEINLFMKYYHKSHHNPDQE